MGVPASSTYENGHDHPGLGRRTWRPAGQRIATTRNAQLTSTAIHPLFLALATVLFHGDLSADVTAIIASRAFALYYPLQCGVAFFVAHHRMKVSARSHHRLAMCALLTLVCFPVFAPGIPSGG